MRRTRVSLSMSKEAVEYIKAKAKEENRSASNLVESLILREMKKK